MYENLSKGRERRDTTPVAEKTDKLGRQFMDMESILFMQNRMVFIDNVIDDSLASNAIKQLMNLATVSNENITLVINSPGRSDGRRIT